MKLVAWCIPWNKACACLAPVLLLRSLSLYGLRCFAHICWAAIFFLFASSFLARSASSASLLARCCSIKSFCFFFSRMSAISALQAAVTVSIFPFLRRPWTSSFIWKLIPLPAFLGSKYIWTVTARNIAKLRSLNSDPFANPNPSRIVRETP